MLLGRWDSNQLILLLWGGGLESARPAVVLNMADSDRDEVGPCSSPSYTNACLWRRGPLPSSTDIYFLSTCVLLTVPVRLDPGATSSLLPFAYHVKFRDLGRRSGTQGTLEQE